MLERDPDNVQIPELLGETYLEMKDLRYGRSQARCAGAAVMAA